MSPVRLEANETEQLQWKLTVNDLLCYDPVRNAFYSKQV